MVNNSNRRTKMMLRLEREFGDGIDDLLVRLILEHGRAGAAEKLEISDATLGYWLLKRGIRTETVLLRAGESVQIVRTESH